MQKMNDVTVKSIKSYCKKKDKIYDKDEVLQKGSHRHKNSWKHIVTEIQVVDAGKAAVQGLDNLSYPGNLKY